MASEVDKCTVATFGINEWKRVLRKYTEAPSLPETRCLRNRKLAPIESYGTR